MWLAEGTQAYADAYDARFGDVDDENPEVLERCIVKFQEDYPVYFSEYADDEFIALLMRVAINEQPDNALVQAFIAMIRNHYNEKQDEYIERHYWNEHEKWCDDQNSY